MSSCVLERRTVDARAEVRRRSAFSGPGVGSRFTVGRAAAGASDSVRWRAHFETASGSKISFPGLPSRLCLVGRPPVPWCAPARGRTRVSDGCDRPTGA